MVKRKTESPYSKNSEHSLSQYSEFSFNYQKLLRIEEDLLLFSPDVVVSIVVPALTSSIFPIKFQLFVYAQRNKITLLAFIVAMTRELVRVQRFNNGTSE